MFFYAMGIHFFSFAFTGLGLIGVVACVSSIFIRIVVSADGIKKSPWITAGFVLRWENIDSWSVIPPRFDDPRLVRFRIRGRRLPRVVADYDVENPGFETFLEQIKEYISQKEIVENETAEIYYDFFFSLNAYSLSTGTAPLIYKAANRAPRSTRIAAIIFYNKT
jgi:hypothetical protein